MLRGVAVLLTLLVICIAREAWAREFTDDRPAIAISFTEIRLMK